MSRGKWVSPARSGVATSRAIRASIAERSVEFNMPFLDDIAVGIIPEDVIVIAAETGAGKTSLAMLLALAASRRGARVRCFSLESMDHELEHRMVYAELARLAWERDVPGRDSLSYAHWLQGFCTDVERAVLDEAERNVVEVTRSLEVYYSSGSFDTVALAAEMTALQKQADLIVLDHLHFVDHDERDENVGMHRIVKTISQCVKDAHIPVIAIAHLRKKDRRVSGLVPRLEELHGSSSITKIATRVITMAPAEDRESRSPGVHPTYLHVAKDRFVGKLGYTGLLWYNARTGRYREQYALGRINRAGTEWQQVAAAHMPFWAKHALRPEVG